MEEIALNSSLRHYDHTPPKQENPTQKTFFGDEENAPQNLLEGEPLTKLQQKVIKRMRMGGTPYKRSGSRRFSSSDNTQSLSSLDGNLQQQENHHPSNNFSVTSYASIGMAVLPHKQSSNQASPGDFGKQNNANIETKTIRHSIATTNATDKDPRFHSKKTLERAEKALAREERLSLGREVTFHEEEELNPPQVFLAPVLGPPSTTSPWETAPVQQPIGMHPCSTTATRSSFTEESKTAIAAAQEAQEAPDLLTLTSSQDSLSSSTAPSSSNTSSSAASMASDLVKRLVNNKKGATHHPQETAKARFPTRHAAPRGTPVRIKARARPQEVQATDSGYASVAKLSAWLADDPTSTKKVKQVRRGANVIAKSRQFEKDMEYVIAEENSISSGAVKQKKDWLKTVFSGDCEDEDMDVHNHHSSNHHMMRMRTQPVTMDDSCARSEFFVSNDTASAISVTNKKKWLENAFKKEGQGLASRARSDIGPLQESRDDITSRAKKLWKQNSEKRMTEKPPASAQKPPRASAASPWGKHGTSRPPASRDTTPRKLMEEVPKMSMSSRSSAPPYMMAKAANATASGATKDAPRHSIAGSQVEEDNTPVNFRAARELLIQRSKVNGNEVKVASKVQRKTDKFERITKESKRRSSAMGLLKPTWSSDSGSEAPSDAYTKMFAEDIAPKRSFDELP